VIVALGNNRRAKSRGGNHHEHTRKQTGGHNGGFTKVDQTKDPCFFIEFPDARKGILAGGTPLTGPCPINPDAVPGTAATNLAPGQATVCVDNLVQKFLGLYPLPNGPILGDVGIFTYPAQQIINENFFTTRIDHRFSEKDSLYGTYMYDDSSFSQPDNLGAVLIGHHVNRNLVALEETHIFSPTLVNSVRLGYNRAGVAIDQGLHAINPLAEDTSLGAAPGQNAPQVSVGGLSPMFNGGLDSPSSSHYYWNSFQGYDDASLTRGAHSIKFGGGVERIDFNFLAASVPGGQYNFVSLSKFLTNHPKRLKLTIPGVITPRLSRPHQPTLCCSFCWPPSDRATTRLMHWPWIVIYLYRFPSEAQVKLTRFLFFATVWLSWQLQESTSPTMAQPRTI
jgi:hypothetical protein